MRRSCTLPEAAGCDLVLMASHGRRDCRARMAGSVTHRVVDRAKVAVLNARVESNFVADAQERALSAIRDDHRSLAAVLSAMQRIPASASQAARHSTRR
jgi:hypothetical protein